MSRTRDFLAGIGNLFKGFGFLLSNPRLWAWAVMPTLINLLLLAAMLFAFVHYYGDIYGWLTAHIGHLNIANPDTWYWRVLDALLWVADLLLQILIVLISLVLLLIVAYALSFIVAGPFNDALSERVEVMVTGHEPPPFSFGKFIKDILRTVRIEAIKAVILLSIPIVLFVLNFIPVVGGLLYVVLTFVFGAWDLGFSYADIPNGRRVVPLRERWRFARKNRWALIGLGAGFIIPFFSLIFAAPMVVGGTLMYIDSHKASS